MKQQFLRQSGDSYQTLRANQVEICVRVGRMVREDRQEKSGRQKISICCLMNGQLLLTALSIFSLRVEQFILRVWQVPQDLRGTEQHPASQSSSGLWHCRQQCCLYKANLCLQIVMHYLIADEKTAFLLEQSTGLTGHLYNQTQDLIRPKSMDISGKTQGKLRTFFLWPECIY